jgi:hypothetical protein
MSTKDAYTKRIDAELELVQEKLARFKAQGMSFTADARVKHAKHVEKLEQKLDATKAKLMELGEADEHVWEQLKDGVEDMWTTLQSTFENTITTFKEEHTQHE